MLRYLINRIIAFIPTLLGVSILIFLAIRMVPGDQITAMLGTEAGMLTEAQRAALEEYFGLDKPIVEQYFTWLGNALRGNLGYSVRHGQPVLDVILERLPATLILMGSALSLAIVLLVAIGACTGFFVVPMNAMLQHRGQRLLGSGESIAVQNFNENLAVLAMLAA